jgi:hypothetical protein
MLQFAGPGGYGFMSYPETRRGSDELKEKGRFEKGVFRYEDASGTTRNQDGYEAVWEHVNGRKIEYVRPRYREPVVIDPEAYAWTPVPGSSGGLAKPLGIFNERGTAANYYRVEANGELVLRAEGRRRLLFVVRGSVTVDGADLVAHTAVAFGPGEEAELRTSGEAVELLNYDLPSFEGRHG